MKIQITLAELNGIVDSLNSFVKLQIPIKYAYRFGKVAKILQKELLSFKEQYNNLIKKYGETLDDGNIRVSAEKRSLFIQESDDLQKEIIDIDFEPIPLSALSNTNASIADMAWLEKFFIDDSEQGNV